MLKAKMFVCVGKRFMDVSFARMGCFEVGMLTAKTRRALPDGIRFIGMRSDLMTDGTIGQEHGGLGVLKTTAHEAATGFREDCRI